MQGDTPLFPNMLNNGKVEVCLKEDVDKALAEKDAEIQKWKSARDECERQFQAQVEETGKYLSQVLELKKQVHDYAQGLYAIQARAEKESQHHKYKRCLDNAWGCQQRMELFHELVLEEARRIALPNEKVLKEYRSKRERAAKWHKRWLELAAKFKINSTAQ